ncbi:MAG: pyridoxamine 5'-phosphate oxidase family protein [Clostridium sp.]|jgi:nitroimidazol reductase NimA-like FMN-containing flavoprotein (pyridoxamine 5'-phosphate oxidase superfamily)|nr:pyridoxamine 5'-phosphate oxidase family protein [Clostridium sp.]
MNPKSAMDMEQIHTLLNRLPVGTLASVNADGSPYAVPVHFVSMDNRVYLHSGYHGQKFENLCHDGRVCFTAWEMFGLRLPGGDEPCRTATNYESVVITGTADVVEELPLKRAVLREFAAKYTPDKNADHIPDPAVERTCVIAIEAGRITGKRKAEKTVTKK